jgi:predicted NAD/FAD-binding protein
MVSSNGRGEAFDAVVFATHAPTTLSLLADASERERAISAPCATSPIPPGCTPMPA